MRARARPLFLRTVFQILLRISQSNGKNENPKTDISALKSVFGKSKSGFPNRTHPKCLKNGTDLLRKGNSDGEEIYKRACMITVPKLIVDLDFKVVALFAVFVGVDVTVITS